MKKTLKSISWQVDEPTYRADEAFSYSTLSRFHREGFSKIDSLFDPISSPYLTFGSLVDTLITGSIEEYSNLFCVAQFPSISPSQEVAVKKIFELYKNDYTDLKKIPTNKVLDVLNDIEYQKNWNDDTRVKKIKDQCSDYYNLLIFTDGKEIISSEDNMAANACVDKLRNSPVTSKYFTEAPFEDYIDREYQLKFKGEYNGIPVRCMADLIVVDHKNKVVIPVDLKTSSKPEWEFADSFIHWGYYIQAQLYWYIIRQNMDKDDYFKDFKLLDYRFIVISRNTLTPLVWNYKDTTKEETLYYGSNKIECKNWREILTELNYYIQNKPQVPINISLNKENDLTKLLQL